MHVAHIPNGSFKDILAHRRKSFPKLSRAELSMLRERLHLDWGSNPELADLRTMPEFKELCNFADAICDYIGIPPINIFWYPQHPCLNGFLTTESNSIIIVGDIRNVWSNILDALIGHEMGHGIQGDLEDAIGHKIYDDEIIKVCQRTIEYRCDTFSFLMSSSQAVHNLLYKFEEQTWETYKPATLNEQTQLFMRSNGPYPGIMSRRISAIALDNSPSWQEFVAPSSNKDKLMDIVYSKRPERRGVFLITDPEDKKRAMQLLKKAPFHDVKLAR